MATVGRTTQGATGKSVENRPLVRRVTLNSGDEITSIDIWILCDNVNKDATPAVYDTSGNRLAVGSATAVVANASAQNPQLPISYTIPSTGDYYVGMALASGAGNGHVYFDAGSADVKYDADATLGTPPPATWTNWAAEGITDDVSIAATYTPAAAGGTAKRSTLESPIFNSRILQ
jgi:hypothetical protein